MAQSLATTNLGQVGSYAPGVRNALPYNSSSGSFRAVRTAPSNFGTGSPGRLGPAVRTPSVRQGRQAPATKLVMPKLRSSLGRRR